MTRVFALTAAASHGYFEVEIPPFAAENCGLRLPRIPIFFPGVLHFDPGQPLVHHEVREPYHAEDYICILYLSLHLKKKIGTNNNHTHTQKKNPWNVCFALAWLYMMVTLQLDSLKEWTLCQLQRLKQFWGENGYNLKAKNVKRVIYTTYRHTAWKHLPTFHSGKAEESKTTTQKDVQLFWIV